MGPSGNRVSDSFIIISHYEGFKRASRDRKKVKNVAHDGNLTLDQVIDIAHTMRDRSMARTLTGTVKEILGTCNSIGCSVNGESPRDMQASIDEGDIEIPCE